MLHLSSHIPWPINGQSNPSKSYTNIWEVCISTHSTRTRRMPIKLSINCFLSPVDHGRRHAACRTCVAMVSYLSYLVVGEIFRSIAMCYVVFSGAARICFELLHFVGWFRAPDAPGVPGRPQEFAALQKSAPRTMSKAILGRSKTLARLRSVTQLKKPYKFHCHDVNIELVVQMSAWFQSFVYHLVEYTIRITGRECEYDGSQ